MSHFADEANFVLWKLNDAEPNKAYREFEKDRFKKALQLIHSEGYYILYSHKHKCFTLSDKRPEMLTKQIAEIDKLIDAVIKIVSK